MSKTINIAIRQYIAQYFLSYNYFRNISVQTHPQFPFYIFSKLCFQKTPVLYLTYSDLHNGPSASQTKKFFIDIWYICLIAKRSPCRIVDQCRKPLPNFMTLPSSVPFYSRPGAEDGKQALLFWLLVLFCRWKQVQSKVFYITN